MDKHTYQLAMEKLFHKNQLVPRIKGEFENSKDPDFLKYMRDNAINEAFGLDVLTQMVLHKRASVKVLAGILRRHFNDSQRTVDELYKCVEADLIDWNHMTEQFVIKIDISNDIKEELDRYQYPLPMIVEPKKLTDNASSGYLSGASSVILKNNHHDDDVCLEHLDAMNAIPLKINHTTANLIKNEWKNLDKPKPDEDIKDFKRRQKQFEKYDRTAKDVMVHLEVADNRFFLTHKYDKRGRVYCQGYHVNYQGTAWNKAVIEFADGEIIND
jgi:hypothetical protein